MGQLARLGQALPAKVVSVQGSIVTVSFLVQGPYTLPNVTMPIAGPQWSRAPTQVGDLGVCIPASVYIGGVSGLGGGVADFTQRAPLSTLTFFPVGNANWTAPDDANAWVIYGPNGAILRDSQSQIVLKLQPTVAELTLPAGVSFVINGNVEITGNLALGGSLTGVNGGTYAAALKTTGDIIGNVGAGQVSLVNHTHTQAADSHGDTEQPTSAPTAGT
jgi:hypothetical protein